MPSEPSAIDHDAGLHMLQASADVIKRLLRNADQQALRGDGTVPPATALDIRHQFSEFFANLNHVLGDLSPLSIDVKSTVAASIQKQLLPFIALADTAYRFYSKPRGYAGDYLTIWKLYHAPPSGTGRIGALIDSCFLSQPAAVAVRNRRRLMTDLIYRTVQGNCEPVSFVTSLACGPAQELFDVFDRPGLRVRLKCHAVDIDQEALGFVKEKRDRLDLVDQIGLVQSNLVHVARGRRTLELPPQDLIYSVGLIDYFADDIVIALLNTIFDLLKPGGRVLLGNFHPANPDKALMDHILDWKLTHRTEEDMHRMFRASRFGKSAGRIYYEGQGINLFAECHKGG